MNRDIELQQIEEFLASGRTIVCEDSRTIVRIQETARITTPYHRGWKPGRKSRKVAK